ncbi:MAG TPA: hypothetical protein HA349_00905 [Methanotrichaceae archaeon]|nr:hypothetical protein [Methanotrichaceae archaeon]
MEVLTISGTNFYDFDLDGMMDPGESGVQGWTVRLMGDGDELFSTITDEDGHYEFSDLAPGDYTISLDLMDGWNQTMPVDGFYEIALLDEDEYGWDFGIYNGSEASPSDEHPEVRVADSMKMILTSDESSADVGVLASDGDGTTIDVSVQGVGVEEATVGGVTYQILTIADRGYTSLVGKPQIPVIRETVAIPDGASVRATVLDSSYSTHEGYRVYPVQPPEIDGDESGEFVIDEDFYSQDIFYPQKIVEVTAPAVWRDLTVVNLQVNPVMFNPATGQLRVYDHIKIKVEYGDGVAFAQKTIEPKFSEIYSKVILNYEALDVVVGLPKIRVEETVPSQEGFNLCGDFERLDQTTKFLLIYHEDCSSFESLEPLIDLHEQNGLPCEVWNISAGSLPTSVDIKALITSRYAAHSELEYVLLVGDIDTLPWNPSWYGVPGDYWYGCIAGNDLWPELAVGRLSVTNDAEVQQQVNKILTYEQNPPSGDWSNKVLLVAHKEEAPGKYQGCKEGIRTKAYVDPLTFETAYGAAPAQGGDSATNADVKSAVDAGVGILNYRGHGAGPYWGSNWNVEYESYDNTDAHALENGDKTPIVFSIACSNTALDYTAECLGEAFVKDDDSAVAFLGATRPSYTIPNHEFDSYLFEAVGDEQIYDVGWALNYANSRLISNYGPTHVYMENVRMYLWLGDPALSINIVPPNSPPNAPDTPTGPITGYTGLLYYYSTSTTDPDVG